MNPSGQKQRKSAPKSNAGEPVQLTKRAKAPVAQEPIEIDLEQETLPKIPEVKRVVKSKKVYCSLKKGFERNPKCFEMRCCMHRNKNETKVGST